MLLGNLIDLTPTVNFATKQSSEPGEYWGVREIPDCQLIYVLSGEVQLILGPDSYSIRPGECVFYGHNSPHILTSVRHSTFYSLHFTWHAPSSQPVHPAYHIKEVRKTELARHPESYSLTIEGRGEFTIPHHFVLSGVEPLMARIVKVYLQPDDWGASFAMRALMMELLLTLVRNVTEHKTAESASKIELALHAMKEEPTRNWSVAELADVCGYHPSYFARLFAEQTGTSPKQYIISERIKLAKLALLKGEPMETIAQRLGYASIHYFSNNFKKETGLTPSEFRQMPGRMARERE
ncbi:helix-turn-helix transcriptional regulator [Paenibacillus mendelii]|uniref:AraC family transcriptional regulator n=1 Tax=Paenibacillus mendelii TaxID=206163 RepID=A0ABV6JBX7_9BACL|nr:AraC family transcriptional regulator [Paenibacillus mendelii]MCQ6559467.1 AraC family transcriptional regulator [Paenibacillus mendelii]